MSPHNRRRYSRYFGVRWENLAVPALYDPMLRLVAGAVMRKSERRMLEGGVGWAGVGARVGVPARVSPFAYAVQATSIQVRFLLRFGDDYE